MYLAAHGSITLAMPLAHGPGDLAGRRHGMDSMERSGQQDGRDDEVRLALGAATLEGVLSVPEDAQGVVLFAHGSGSSRHSPRNRYVAGELRAAGLATLLIDLLTPDEEAVDLRTGRLRFDIGLLAARLVGATDWLGQRPATRGL